VQRGRESGEQSCHECRCDSDAENTSVTKRVRPFDVLEQERAQRPAAPLCQHEARQRAEASEQQALGDELADETRATHT
jgi:hypothetical protein